MSLRDYGLPDSEPVGVPTWSETEHPCPNCGANVCEVEVKVPKVELEVKAQLKQLKGAIEEDSAILSRMAVAARTILREVKKISNRNALDGNYGKMGQRVSGVADKNMHVDQKF